MELKTAEDGVEVIVESIFWSAIGEWSVGNWFKALMLNAGMVMVWRPVYQALHSTSWWLLAFLSSLLPPFPDSEGFLAWFPRREDRPCIDTDVGILNKLALGLNSELKLRLGKSAKKKNPDKIC